MSLCEQDRRNLICKFCKENPSSTKNDVFHHFKQMKFKKTFIYRTIHLFDNKKNLQRKPGSGKKCALQNSIARAKLKGETVGKSAKSYRQLGKKYHVDDKTIKKYLLDMGIQRKKKKVAPRTSDRQKSLIKSRLKSFSKNYFSPSSIYKCVMDDESYFTVEGHEWQQKSYYESQESKAPETVRYIRKSKFPAKVMVWLAVSENGISDPVFFKGGLAVNKTVYIQRCLPVLQKFINKYHKHDKVLFWPDLASSHYAKDTIVDLVKRKIEFVPRDQNPPNVPQLRPIENFWANLKRKVYSNSYNAKNVDSLIAKIKNVLKTIDTTGVQRAMRKLPLIIRKANRKGVNVFL